MMEEKDILKKLIKSDALFSKIHVITQKYDIIPDNKPHIGTYIEYNDLMELRSEFLEELLDTIVDWVYNSEKFEELRIKAEKKGKSTAAANSEVINKAKARFRGNHNSDNLLVQGQMGELLLFQFIQHCMKAIPLLRKMPITTSSEHERFGADAIHYKIENGKNIIILGEAKTYTSKYKFNEAFEKSIKSILDTYDKHRKEIKSYIHEDFLTDDMNEIAESYINNTLNNFEVHLVSIIIYNETTLLNMTSEKEIKDQIERIIEDRYSNYDNTKINIKNNPILSRITYIVFPVWDLDKLAIEFQSMI